MKRKLFIGSAREGLSISEILKEKLNLAFADFLECELWSDGKIFSLNKGTLDSLVQASRKFDYGVLVATAEDVRRSKNKQTRIPRDNVMFEMGLFIGSLGLTRAFLLVEKPTTLPTDYNGVTVPSFEKDNIESLEKAIEQIILSIKNTKKSFNLKPIPSAALALSYFDNFIQPLAKKRLKDGKIISLNILLPTSLKDIKTTISYYKAKNKSNEISAYGDGSRPMVYEYIDKEDEYWDIPTTLSTLNKLIDLVSHSKEIGIEEEKEAWIIHELRNFKGTIEILSSQCDACKDSVFVSFL